MTGLPAARTFAGYRPDPPAEYQAAGITNAGTAPDYWGCIFPDGTVAIRWGTAYRSHSIWPDWATFHQVHGHPEYGTLIYFDDEEPPPVVFIDGTARADQLIADHAGPAEPIRPDPVDPAGPPPRPRTAQYNVSGPPPPGGDDGPPWP